MNKWQKEINRFSKWSVKNLKKKLSFRQHRRLTRYWAKGYNTFESFKQHNNELINRRLQRRILNE